MSFAGAEVGAGGVAAIRMFSLFRLLSPSGVRLASPLSGFWEVDKSLDLLPISSLSED